MPTQQILDLVGSRGQVHCTFLQQFLLTFPSPSVHLNVMPFAMWSFIGALGTYPGSLRCCAKIPLWVLFGTWCDWCVLFTMWLFAYFLAWVRTLPIPTVPNSGRPSGRFWVMWSYLVSRSYVGRGIFCNTTSNLLVIFNFCVQLRSSCVFLVLSVAQIEGIEFHNRAGVKYQIKCNLSSSSGICDYKLCNTSCWCFMVVIMLKLNALVLLWLSYFDGILWGIALGKLKQSEKEREAR